MEKQEITQVSRFPQIKDIEFPVLVAGYGNTYKTTIALAIAYDQAMECGIDDKVCIHVSSHERDPIQLMTMLSRHLKFSSEQAFLARAASHGITFTFSNSLTPPDVQDGVQAFWIIDDISHISTLNPCPESIDCEDAIQFVKSTNDKTNKVLSHAHLSGIRLIVIDNLLKPFFKTGVKSETPCIRQKDRLTFFNSFVLTSSIKGLHPVSTLDSIKFLDRFPVDVPIRPGDKVIVAFSYQKAEFSADQGPKWKVLPYSPPRFGFKELSVSSNIIITDLVGNGEPMIVCEDGTPIPIHYGHGLYPTKDMAMEDLFHRFPNFTLIS